MRKISIIAIMTFILLAIAVLCGCNCNETPVPTPEIVGKYEIELYDDITIREEKSGAIWRVSDTDIISVDNGLVIAKKVGTATVFSKTEGVEKGYTVTVVDKGNLPELICSDSTVAIGANGKIATSLIYLSKSKQDYSLKFTTGNTDVVEINQATGAFTAKSKGMAKILVTASWRNVPEEVLAKEITVKVEDKPSVTVGAAFLGNDAVDKIEVFSADRIGTKIFKNTEQIGIVVSNNGKVVDIEKGDVRFELSDERVAIVNMTADDIIEITGNREGKTVLNIIYTEKESKEEFSAHIDIIVKLSKTDLIGRYMFGSGEILPQDIKKLIPDCNYISNLSVGKDILKDGIENIDNCSDGVWFVSDGKIGYTFNAKHVNKIVIKTEEDFLSLFEKLDVVYNESTKKIIIDGYVVLEANLDFSSMNQEDYNKNCIISRTEYSGYGWLGYSKLSEDKLKQYTTNSNKYNENEGFIGTIDGNGYSIKGLTIGHYGLFPGVGSSALIKNLALTDVTLAKYSSVFGYNFYGSMDNCLLDIKRDMGETVAGVALSVMGKLSNSIIFFPDLTADNGKHFGAVTRDYKSSKPWEINNVYVVGNADGVAIAREADRIGVDCSFYFKSLKEFNEAEKNYSEFNTDIWNMTGYDVPVFKTYNGTNIVRKVIGENAKKLLVSKADQVSVVDLSLDITGVNAVTIGNLKIEYEFDPSKKTLKVQSADFSDIANGEYVMVLNADEGLYKLGVIVADKVIKTEEEFLNLFNYLTIDITKDSRFITMDGYIEIGADLDFSSMSQSEYNAVRGLSISGNPATTEKGRGFGFASYLDESVITTEQLKTFESVSDYGGYNGFIGTIDGQGHSIKGLQIASWGIFPAVGSNGTIKNLAFTDTSLGATYSYVLSGNNFYGTLDNCLIDVKTVQAGEQIRMFKLFGGKLKNSIVNIPVLGAGNNATSAAIGYKSTQNNYTITNAYVIGTENVVAIRITKGDTSIVTDEYYTSIDKFNEAEKDYQGFNAEIWDFIGYEIPVFKTYNGTNITKKA